MKILKYLLKLIGKIFAIIITYCYFIIINILLIVILTFDIINSNFFEKYINNIDLSKINIPFISDVTDINIDESIKSILTNNGINENDADKIINNDSFKSILGSFLDDSINYYIFDGSVPEIDENKLKEVLTNNNININEINDIVNNINLSIKENIPEKEEVLNNGNEIENTYLKTMFNILNNIKNIVNKMLDFNKYIFYITLTIITIIIYLILSLLYFNFYKPLKDIGICLLLNGLFLLSMYFFLSKIISNEIFNLISDKALLLGLIITISSIIFIVLYFTLKNKKEHIKFNFEENEKSS